VIVQVDGGHIPLKQRDKRSFEALSGVVYRQKASGIDQHHREIKRAWPYQLKMIT